MPFLPQWWSEIPRPPGTPDNVTVFGEQAGARALVFDALVETTADHFVKADLLASLDFPMASQLLRARVPQGKKIRSGDFGEVLCTEYVSQYTDYRVPLKRLRHKEAREMSMRGEDLVAVRERNGRVQMLKAEAKSRATLYASTVEEACAALRRGRARPSEDTLAFIYMRLSDEGRSDDAELLKRCLSDTIADTDVEHLIFTFSGNDPVAALQSYAKGPVARRMAGFMVPDHQVLVHSVFEGIHAKR